MTALLAGLALLILAFLAATTVFSSDDYMYSMYLDGGLDNFLSLMREHYNTINGRMLVLFCAMVTLHFGNWLFVVVMLGASVFLALSPNLASGESGNRKAAQILLFSVGLLVMPLGMIRQGLLWITAYYNYVWPTAMICGELCLLSWLARRDRAPGWAWPVCLLAAFLCGATTEQSGIVAISLGLAYVLIFLWERRGVGAILPLLSAGSSGIGFLTDFLAPGTHARFESETELTGLHAVVDKCLDGFARSAELLSENWAAAALMAILFLCVGGLIWKAGKGPAFLVAAAALSILALLSPLALGIVRTALYLLLFGALGLCALGLLWLGKRELALLLLFGMLTLLLVTPTNSVSSRALLPFYLYLLIVGTGLAGQWLGRIPPAASNLVCTAALALAVLLRLPFAAGSWYNYEIDQINRENARVARETGVFYFSMDYDLRYTFTKAYGDGFFYGMMLEAAGLSEEETQIYLYQTGLPSVWVGGERMTSPAIQGAGEGHLLPLRGIIETLGGRVDVAGDNVLVDLSGVSYTITHPSWGQARIQWKDREGVERTVTVERGENYFQLCLGREAFTQAFQLQVTDDPEENRIIVNQ